MMLGEQVPFPHPNWLMWYEENDEVDLADMINDPEGEQEPYDGHDENN